MKIDWRVIITGIVCLTVAECFALANGINGNIYSLYLMIIGGAIGVFINPFGGKK